MNTVDFFSAEDYFNNLLAKNRLAADAGFIFCTCSGIESLQGPLDMFRKKSAFFCLDDVNDGRMYQARGGGFYKKRTLTVFIMHRHKFNDEDDRLAKLAICRNLFRQVSSRLLVDSKKLRSDLIYLNAGNILCREFGQYFMNGCTGLYFMVDVEEPVDLKFNGDEWFE